MGSIWKKLTLSNISMFYYYFFFLQKKDLFITEKYLFVTPKSVWLSSWRKSVLSNIYRNKKCVWRYFIANGHFRKDLFITDKYLFVTPKSV